MSVLILVSVVVTAQRVMCCMCFECYLRTAVLFYLSVLLCYLTTHSVASVTDE